jgi:hypothetical protein
MGEGSRLDRFRQRFRRPAGKKDAVTMPEQKQGLSRRDFLRISSWVLGSTALAGGGFVLKELNSQPESSGQDVVGVREETTDGVTKYSFFLKGNPQGKVFDDIRALQEKTGKMSFDIVVDPKQDRFLNDLTEQVFIKDFREVVNSLPVEQRLEEVSTRVLSVFKDNNLFYFHWFHDNKNLERFLTEGTMLGDRMRDTFTCYEAAVFTKRIFTELGIDTDFDFTELHVGLSYLAEDGKKHSIEPLFGRVFSKE